MNPASSISKPYISELESIRKTQTVPSGNGDDQLLVSTEPLFFLQKASHKQNSPKVTRARIWQQLLRRSKAIDNVIDICAHKPFVIFALRLFSVVGRRFCHVDK